tara:strand:+ start:19 stop:474 length:456 start_codon:yes stop_codon:yes gene_type:complete
MLCFFLSCKFFFSGHKTTKNITATHFFSALCYAPNHSHLPFDPHVSTTKNNFSCASFYKQKSSCAFTLKHRKTLCYQGIWMPVVTLHFLQPHALTQTNNTFGKKNLTHVFQLKILPALRLGDTLNPQLQSTLDRHETVTKIKKNRYCHQIS